MRPEGKKVYQNEKLCGCVDSANQDNSYCHPDARPGNCTVTHHAYTDAELAALIADVGNEAVAKYRAELLDMTQEEAGAVTMSAPVAARIQQLFEDVKTARREALEEYKTACPHCSFKAGEHSGFCKTLRALAAKEEE